MRILTLRPGSWRQIVLDTYTEWRTHRTIRLGASLAYYGLFAVIPLLAISAAIAGIVLNDIDIEETLTTVLSDLVDDDDSASQMAAAIADKLDTTGTSAGLGLFGLASLLLAASVVFVALQDALDTIWEVPVHSGAANTVRRRALAFAVVLLSGAVLIASFAVSAMSGLVRDLAPGGSALSAVAADLFTVVGLWALAAGVLSFLFRFLTRATVQWRTALAGGVITALALTVGNRAATEYLSRYGASSLAEAAGSVLVLLFWVYAIAQIVLVGAELTRTLELTLITPLQDNKGNDTDPSPNGQAS